MSNVLKLPNWAQFALALLIGGALVVGIGLAVRGSDDSSSTASEASPAANSDETSTDEPSDADEDEDPVAESPDDSTAEPASTPEPDPTDDADATEEAESADDADTTEEAGADPTTEATVDGEPVATLLASLDGGDFTLRGVVPDEETADRLALAAITAYGFTADIDLEVSPDVAEPAWLSTAHNGITLIPMITEGFIEVTGDAVSVGGVSPNPDYLAAFEQAVSTSFAVSDVSSDVEITNLAPPQFTVRRANGIVTLTGTLPDEEIRAYIVDGATNVYGAESVDDQTTVGEGLYKSFWMFSMPDVFLFFNAFPDYEIDVTDGITSGAVNDGINFITGSSELSPEVESVLTIAAALLVRDQTLGIRMTGHTDSIGDADSNQRLSEQRAGAAVDFLLESGIDASRLQATGRGESEPIASNDTAEGRAKNRRIEFDFGPVS